ncbi:MAG: Holliday junction branch migration protein RuvA [Gammaproteobacteria bacterium]|nr:Holliday junction branch migration protein RuvA [Gammaproteobacteria bacterium]
MIGRLHGRVLAKQPPWLLLDVAGVGYELELPMSSFFTLPAEGQLVTLHTHLVVREDAHLLFGFGGEAERTLFRALIKVSGVGPRVALAVLSGISVEAFWNAVRLGDAALLTRTPGIGKRTAERLLLELRGRAEGVAAAGPVTPAGGADQPLIEARAALTALGYKPAEVTRYTEAVYKDGMDAEKIIREALKRALR